jgi:hypothetical protein
MGNSTIAGMADDGNFYCNKTDECPIHKNEKLAEKELEKAEVKIANLEAEVSSMEFAIKKVIKREGGFAYDSHAELCEILKELLREVVK